jgi:DNA-binding CsgD family transcriptional regulator
MKTLPAQSYTVDELKRIIGFNNRTDHPHQARNILDMLVYHYMQGSNRCFLILTDYSNMEYLNVFQSVENLLGYPAEMVKCGGMEFMFSLLHPNEMMAVKQIHQKIVSFFNSLPIEERLNYGYTYDLSLRKADGEYLRVICELDCSELDKLGHLSAGIETYTEVSHFDDKPYLTLEIRHKGRSQKVPDIVCRFGICGEEEVLTKKEKQIYDLVREGYQSKEIATMLSISVNTVNTHRERIKKKLKGRDDINTLN